MTFRQTDGPAIAAAKASISSATAYRFEQNHEMPSAERQPRGRRRPDPLAAFFDAEVVPMLTAAPDCVGPPLPTIAVRITDDGRRRFLSYIDQLESVVRDVHRRAGEPANERWAPQS